MTIFPHRRITVTVEHKNIEYRSLCRSWYQAMRELEKADPDGSITHFVASNGVEITIHPEPCYASWWELITYPLAIRWRRGWGFSPFGGRKA